jgi:hypothetical protein
LGDNRTDFSFAIRASLWYVLPFTEKGGPINMEPSKDWQEIVAPDEETRFATFASQLVEVQRMNAVNGRVGRAVHKKIHGGFEARLEILAEVPEYARHGLFASPKVYDALVRYSNGSSGVQADEKSDVRGLAVKVLGVDGPKVLGTARTQDFLTILQSSTPFRNADEFVGVIWATRNPWLALPRLLFTLGLRTFTIMPALIKAVKPPVASLAEKRFYSALPILCGPYAVRFAWLPIAPPAEGTLTGPNYLADDLAARLKKGAVEYALELQFFVDEKRTPIEDGSIDWPIEISPYVRVGKLVIPRQDATSDHGKSLTERVDKLSFDPWHALVEHRPLGNMMRARKPTYYASAQGRGAEGEPEGKMV